MEIDEELAEILGMHLGDGCISKNNRYSEYYLGGDLKEEKEYHNEWVKPLFDKKIMMPLFGKGVEYKEHPKVGIYGFHIFGKAVVEFFESLGVESGPKRDIEIPEEIRKDKNLSLRFLRGLFDTDGNIYFDRNRSAKAKIHKFPQITLNNISKKLIDQVFEILSEMGLHPRLKKPFQGKGKRKLLHSILIYRKADVKYFIKEIGFKNPKHHTKWLVFKKQGYLLPRTTLSERKRILGI